MSKTMNQTPTPSGHVNPPDDSLLIEQVDGPFCTLTLNRPAQYNTLSGQLLENLVDALDRIAASEQIRVVILAANGKAFCAGHDLKQMRANDNHAYQHQLFSHCSQMMQKIVALPQPVIARVQGVAAAAGCQLVASCDLAVASSTAGFAVSGIKLGLFCSTPAVALTRNISRKRAMEMLFTGDTIDAHTALEYGLVNQVAEAQQLDQVVASLAESIASKPPRAIRLGKQLVYQQLNQGLVDAYATATDAIASNMMFDEAREGIDAFIEKRKPNWPD